MDSGASTNRPVVVTLAVDDETQQRWDTLRRRHFPAHRLLVGAHVTLFHAIPGEHADDALADVTALAEETEPFPITEDQPYSLGSGVALRVVSAGLRAVHAVLATRWERLLTRQDSQPFRPHVTVQNKVDAQLAHRTLAELRAAGPSGWTGTATGLALWHYEGGPWAPIRTVPFNRSPTGEPALRVVEGFLSRSLGLPLHIRAQFCPTTQSLPPKICPLT